MVNDIENTTWREEFERLLKSILPEMPGGIAMMKDGAIFVDEIAKMAYQMAKQYVKNNPDANLEIVFANIFKYLIDETVIHELGHLGGMDEDQTKQAAHELAKTAFANWMVWSIIECPKLKKDILWVDCLKCTDDEKDESCPLWAIRHYFYPRQPEAHVFHISELVSPRYAYYNRTQGYREGWEKPFDFFIGTGVHNYLQSMYPAQECELPCSWDLGDVKIIGRADRVDFKTGILYEFKTYATIAFVLQRNAPEPDHVFQVQSYVELLKHSHPWIKVNAVKIILIAKTKDTYKVGFDERYKEFTLKPDPPKDLVDRARALDVALETRIPPDYHCTEWHCKTCPYAKKCKEDGFVPQKTPLKHVKIVEGEETEDTFEDVIRDKFNCYVFNTQRGRKGAAGLKRKDDFILLPDFFIITPKDIPIWCEVKRKFPTPSGEYGFKETEIEHAGHLRKLTKDPILFVVYDTTDSTFYYQTIDYFIKHKPAPVMSRILAHRENKEWPMTLPFYYYSKSVFLPLEECDLFRK